MKKKAIILSVLLVQATLFSCTEETPSRDHIPVLKERVFQLQEAVKARNNAAIDSLLSIKIQSNQQDSDSLLALVYGPDGTFAFTQFGDCDIAYTDDKALVQCYIMDSTHSYNRPLMLGFVCEYDLWLLKRFEPGKEEQDTT